jgi:hypothetical protein
MTTSTTVLTSCKNTKVRNTNRKCVIERKSPTFKKGGITDKNWIQDATASIKRRGTAGKCTPITKPGCTGKAKTLALTFKKMAKAKKK